MLAGDTLEKEYLALKTKLIGRAFLCCEPIFTNHWETKKLLRQVILWELKHLSTM